MSEEQKRKLDESKDKVRKKMANKKRLKWVLLLTKKVRFSFFLKQTVSETTLWPDLYLILNENVKIKSHKGMLSCTSEYF